MSEREQTRYQLATIASETMCFLLEAEYQEGERDPDALMRRLKDLSAYSLTHAEIMDQREGVELLALGKFFGMTSEPGYHQNQERLRLLSEETLTYQGQAETIEGEVAARKVEPPIRNGAEMPDCSPDYSNGSKPRPRSFSETQAS